MTEHAQMAHGQLRSSRDPFRHLFAYRCWASLHARVLLDFADLWADPGIYGNRKGYQAAHLWKDLVNQLEVAYSTGACLSGLAADIEKAYNCLPRWPIFCAALFAGTPFGVMTGWVGAVTSMKRHFKVQDSFSSGFDTSTGLAEGCALSCYGMLVLDHLFHVWLREQCPQKSGPSVMSTTGTSQLAILILPLTSCNSCLISPIWLTLPLTVRKPTGGPLVLKSEDASADMVSQSKVQPET